MKSLVCPDELEEIIEAVIEFYQDAVTSIDPSIVFQELRKNLINWVTITAEKIEENKVQQTELTLDQYKAYQDIINFLENNDEQYFRLSG
ncbi:MAG: hypothetical protein WBM32_02285, partial [Crocosphaera sp.]